MFWSQRRSNKCRLWPIQYSQSGSGSASLYSSMKFFNEDDVSINEINKRLPEWCFAQQHENVSVWGWHIYKVGWYWVIDYQNEVLLSLLEGLSHVCGRMAAGVRGVDNSNAGWPQRPEFGRASQIHVLIFVPNFQKSRFLSRIFRKSWFSKNA